MNSSPDRPNGDRRPQSQDRREGDRRPWSRDGRFNALTLRGAEALEVSSIAFDVDLRNAVSIEDESLEPAREAARSAGYAAGWAQGQQAARESTVALRDEAELAVQAS